MRTPSAVSLGKPKLRASRLPVPAGKTASAASLPAIPSTLERTVPSPPHTKTTSAPPAIARRTCPAPGSCAVVSNQTGAGHPASARIVSMTLRRSATPATRIGLMTTAHRRGASPLVTGTDSLAWIHRSDTHGRSNRGVAGVPVLGGVPARRRGRTVGWLVDHGDDLHGRRAGDVEPGCGSRVRRRGAAGSPWGGLAGLLLVAGTVCPDGSGHPDGRVPVDARVSASQSMSSIRRSKVIALWVDSGHGRLPGDGHFAARWRT